MCGINSMIAQECFCNVEEGQQDRKPYSVPYKSDNYVDICISNLLPQILELDGLSLKAAYSIEGRNYFRLMGLYSIDLTSGTIVFGRLKITQSRKRTHDYINLDNAKTLEQIFMTLDPCISEENREILKMNYHHNQYQFYVSYRLFYQP